MKKMLITSLAAVGIAGLIGGGTFASWTDFETVTGNAVEAGTLTIDLDGVGGGGVVPFSAINLAPGENKESHVYVANRSDETVALSNAALFVTVDNLTNYDDGCSSNSELPQEQSNGVGGALQCDDAEAAGATQLSPAAGFGQFADQSRMQIRYKEATSPTSCTGGNPGAHPSPGLPGQGSMTSVAGNGQIPVGNLDPGEGMCITVTIGLPGHPIDGGNDGIDFGGGEADDAVQGDSASFDLLFDLEQVLPNP